MDCVWRIQNDMKVVSSLVLCLSFQNKGIVRSVNDQVVSMVTTLQYIYNRYNLEYLCILCIIRVLCRRATKEQERLSNSPSLPLLITLSPEWTIFIMANLYFVILSPFI